jgi:cytochrome c oxidase subunit 2
MQPQRGFSQIRCVPAFAACLAAAHPAFASGSHANLNIFAPVSTPSRQIYQLSLFTLTITGAIFVSVAGLLLYVILRYRAGKHPPEHEPAQVYGSVQVELAWTIIPILIVLVLFLTTARIIFAIQDAPEPKAAVDVDVIGHQFWWEYRYPKLGVVTANELHIPVSTTAHPAATYLHLFSADVVHSFWVPRLNGKTDLIPNHPNQMWMDPQETGLFLGQCAQFCGVQHAKMLIRVYVDTPQQFDAWVENQKKPAADDPAVAEGRRVFETEACMNCHAISGTAARGTVGPDLTHLMSRDTIGSGIVANTPENLRKWIQNPGSFKEGCMMPAMQLTDRQIDQVVAYLSTLH